LLIFYRIFHFWGLFFKFKLDSIYLRCCLYLHMEIKFILSLILHVCVGLGGCLIIVIFAGCWERATHVEWKKHKKKTPTPTTPTHVAHREILPSIVIQTLLRAPINNPPLQPPAPATHSHLHLHPTQQHNHTPTQTKRLKNGMDSPTNSQSQFPMNELYKRNKLLATIQNRTHWKLKGAWLSIRTRMSQVFSRVYLYTTTRESIYVNTYTIPPLKKKISDRALSK
jgi:hypothetical protein